MKRVFATLVAVIAVTVAHAADNNVECVQQQLTGLGYDPGPVDGTISKKTGAAAAASVADFYLSSKTKPLSAATGSKWCQELTAVAGHLAQVQFQTDLAPTDSLLHKIRAGIAAARKGLGASGTVQVYIYRDMDTLLSVYTNKVPSYTLADAQRMWGFASATVASQGTMFISAAKLQDAQKKGAPNWNAFQLAAHELVHVRSDELMDRRVYRVRMDLTPPEGPRWLSEGLAEFVSFRTLQSWGLDEWTKRKKYVVGKVLTAIESLADLESQTEFDSAREKLTKLGLSTGTNVAYAVSAVAVEYLVEQTSLEKVISEYWKARAKGGPWETTFKEVFGMTPADFYDSFKNAKHAM